MKRGNGRPRLRQVLHLTSVHSAADNRIYWKECRSAAHAGFQVSLVAPRKRANQCSDPTVRLIQLPAWRNRLSRRLLGATLTWAVALREAADIYHFHDPELLPGAFIAAHLGKTVIYDAHEDVEKDLRDRARGRGKLRLTAIRLTAAMYRRLVSKMTAVVAATQPIKADLGHPRSVVICNFPAMPPKEIDHAGVVTQNRVLYVGGITRERGILEMVRAIGKLPENLDAKLILAGPWGDRCLEHAAASTDGWAKVEYLGVLPVSSIPPLLRTARVGLVLFHPLENHTESMPTKMFEYMSAGLPVVASAFDAWRPIVEESGCGILVDPQNPDEIASAIERLLTNPAEAAEMGARGSEAVRHHYSWPAQAAKLTQLYSELLRGKPQALATASERSR